MKRYLNILFLIFIWLGFIACDGAVLSTDNNRSESDPKEEEEEKVKNKEGDTEDLSLGEDTECQYMKVNTIKNMDFKVEGTSGLKHEDNLSNVTVYFPLSSGTIDNNDIKYNLIMGMSQHADAGSDPVKKVRAGVCGYEIQIGSYKYEPLNNKNWEFFTEVPQQCYDINTRFEITIKNYKSKNCSYEIKYNNS